MFSVVLTEEKRSRIWLGSYSSPLAAARAYDIRLLFERPIGSARLNFPELLGSEDMGYSFVKNEEPRD